MVRRVLFFGAAGAAAAAVATAAIVMAGPTTPTVTGLSPNQGVPAGGTQVTVTGTNFKVATVNAVASVSFGATAVTNTPCTAGSPPGNTPCFTVNSATQLTVWTPVHATGTVDITVTSSAGGGTSATSLADQFTYKNLPAVSAVLPASGAVTGWRSLTNPIQVSGTDLTGTTKVSFGTGNDVTTTPCAVRSAGSPPANAPCFDVTSNTQVSAWPPPHAAGVVDVRVTTGVGTSSPNVDDHYTYVASMPSVTGVAPNVGTVVGGDHVVVSGTNLSFATQVDFGSTAVVNTPCSGGNAPCFTVEDQSIGTAIDVTTPAGSAGTVHVDVITSAGTSARSGLDNFTYAPVPTVTSVSPSAGATAGGSKVTITGTGFSGTNVTTQSVQFGSSVVSASPCLAGTPPSNAPCFSVVSATSITAYSPAHAAGTVDVTVTTQGGTSATSASDAFAYASGPTVTAVSPSAGPTAGATTVSITGTSFEDATTNLYTTTTVTIGGTPVTKTPCPTPNLMNTPCFTVSSATSISLLTPAENAGRVDITVTTPIGTSPTAAADMFTYQQPAPTVSSVSPTSGAATGSTKLTVGGTNFSGGGFSVTAVSFAAGTTTTASQTCAAGTPPANVPCFTVDSATSLTVWTPMHPPGTVDVRVVTNAADTSTPMTSATGSPDHYVYLQPTPVVTGLTTSPASTPPGGPLAGGTQVMLAGSGFFGNGFAVTKVSFGSVDVTTTPCHPGTPPNNVPCFTVNDDTSITVYDPAESASDVHVTVTTVTTDGTSSLTSMSSNADKFAYVPAPTVTNTSPIVGSTAGATQVTLTGTNFKSASNPTYTTSKVSFGSSDVTTAPCAAGTPPANAPCFTVNSATQITVFTPSHASGPVQILVTTPGGQSPPNGQNSQFTFNAPTPAVTALSPTAGPTAGLTAVMVTGSGFTAADFVEFGSVQITQTCASQPPSSPCFVVNSDTSITAYSPAESTGVVDVRVDTAGGTSPTNAGNPGDSFDYAPLPTVSGISTITGPVAGGTSTTVTGTNFKDVSASHLFSVTSVNVGTVAVTTAPCNAGTPPNPDNRPCFTVASATQLTVWSPPQSGPGHVDISVTTPGGTSPTSVNDVFAYAPVPSVGSVSPSTGTKAGGAVVTVTGDGFSDPASPSDFTTTKVSFDGKDVTNTPCHAGTPPDNAPCFTVSSPTSLVVTAPAGIAGAIDVTVTTPGGTSPTSASDQFTVPDNVGTDSAALMYSGELHDWYFDATTGSLRHAWRASNGWDVETLDGTGSATGSGQTIDKVGTWVSATLYGSQIQVLYYDVTAGSLRHAWWTGSQWFFEALDGGASSLTGGRIAHNVGTDTAVTPYHGQLHVMYNDRDSGALRHAWWTGSTWDFETLDGAGSATGGGQTQSDSVGTSNAILQFGDQLHAWYHDATAGSLRHGWWTGTGWLFETLDSGGTNNAAVLYGGMPHVWYADTQTGTLRHAWWTGSLWAFESLDGAGSTGGSTGQTGDSVGTYATAVLFGGQPHVWYEDVTAGSLRHAWWTGSAWVFESLDGPGAGTSTGRTTDKVGTFNAATLVASLPDVMYYDATSASLRRAIWTGSQWVFETVDG